MATEKRLIDANALKESVMKEIRHYWNEGEGGYYLAEDVIPDIDLAPTVDAVEVVRCKDCKHYRRKGGVYNDDYCAILYYSDGTHRTSCEIGFCFYGERRKNND